MPDSRKYMARALRLAEQGRFATSPNPMVGAVLVRDGQIVGEGWHHKDGSEHAEANAIADCIARHGRAQGEQLLRGADLYVNLEPCAHFGRQPPCTRTIIEAGIGRVVFAMRDPDPRVAGAGERALRQGGIETECRALDDRALILNAGYLSRCIRQRPWLVLKLAVSMDGRIALPSGASRWITSERARSDVQAQRAGADAVLTGIGTVLADNPQLTLRPEQMSAANRRLLPQGHPGPLRMVLDSSLRTPPKARVLEPGGTLIACSRRVDLQGSAAKALRDRAEVLPLAEGASGQVDPAGALAALHERRCNRVLVECGPGLAGGLMQDALVDEILIYQSARILGSDGLPLWHLPSPKAVPDPKFYLAESRKFGEDIRLRYLHKTSLAQLTPGVL